MRVNIIPGSSKLFKIAQIVEGGFRQGETDRDRVIFNR